MSKNLDVEILDNVDKIKSFLQLIRQLINLKSTVFVGIDFEFDMVQKTHKLSLVQLVFTYPDDRSYSNSKGESYSNSKGGSYSNSKGGSYSNSKGGSYSNSKVYLLDFRLFSRYQFSEFESNVLTNPKVLKIFHGSESLDLPALRKIMSSESSFKDFLNQMVDTRYLCEAHLILLKKMSGVRITKCNIYDALKNANVITDDEYSKLTSIVVNYRKPWKIKHLTDKQITYAVADVVFLFNLYTELTNLLGQDLVNVIMESFRLSVMARMGIITIPNPNERTQKLLDLLETSDVLDKVLASTPLGIFTIRDLFKIDYLKKSAIRIAFDIYVKNKLK